MNPLSIEGRQNRENRTLLSEILKTIEQFDNKRIKIII
jgi:hypothetical protein